MKSKTFFLLTSMLLTVLSGYGQKSGIASLQPVNVADVKITAVNDAYFTDEGIVVVSPDEAPEPALARRRASGLQDEGSAYFVDAKLYSYTYPSVDADGNKVTLSSLMAVPKGATAVPKNLVIGCHVTITSNYECPTEYNKSGGWLSWMTDVGMLIDYTRHDGVRNPRCLVIMPDYEGYGVSKDRAHPYLYQELTARQVVDAVRYGLAFYNSRVGTASGTFEPFESDWQSVSLGYSQGGSVALAVHKFIEENGLANQLHFAGSVCGDGPYDPVAHLRYYITDDGDNYNSEDSKKTAHIAGSVSMPIVMPLILKGMCDSNPLMRQHTVDEYLSQKFLSTGSLDMIEAKKNPNKSDQFSTEDVTKRYQWQRKYGLNNFVKIKDPYSSTDGSFRVYYTPAQVCEMFYEASSPFLGIGLFGDYTVFAKLQEMLTPECYEYFTTTSNFEDANGKRVIPTERGFMQDLHRALESNNLTVGWTPKHRIAFYHSSYDTVVPFVNLCSFVRNHPELSYYIKSPSARLSAANSQPSKVVFDLAKADVFINDINSKDDHIGAGKDFFMMGNKTGTSPDYELYKWVIEGK